MVSKAIRGLGSEIEAMSIVPKHGADNDDVWVAIEHKVCQRRLWVSRLTSDRVKAILFQLDSPKMILTLADAIETLELGQHEEEALNEVRGF